MAPLLVLVVGLLNLANVDLAPAPLSSPKIDGFQIPVLANRFQLEDKRQNWGLLINGSIYTESEDVSYDRPITIPRLSNSPEENVQVKNRADNNSFKPKRYLEKTLTVNNGFQVTNNKPKRTSLQCDEARIKCCVNVEDFMNCSNAYECAKLENTPNLCDANVLQESLKRLLSLY